MSYLRRFRQALSSLRSLPSDHVGAFAMSWLLGVCGNVALAQDAPTATLVTLAKWENIGGRLTIIAPLAEALTTKQRSMINGGFTTVSQLTFSLPDDNNQNSAAPVPFATLRCTVKYDAWEETYDVARLDEKPRIAVLKQLSQYGELCLTAELDDARTVAMLTPTGGTVYARLAVKQTSAEEASRIKDWLIQQQSGVMQGLFSHMLGELTLSQTLIVRINVPPKPAAVEERARQVDVPPVDKKG